MTFSYSVVIRTLGNSGEKYQSLLNSIKAQTVQPEEVIVSMPEGYELDHKLGNERILRAQKGMVSQRAEGMMAVTSDYMLVCDDDIEFKPSFCEDLFKWTIKHKLDCCLPMEGVPDENSDRIKLGLPLMTRIRGAITGQVFVSSRKSDYLDKITSSAGHRIYSTSNKLNECYLAECGNFQCFFAKTSSAKAVHFEDELWLQQGTITQYAAYDDPTFYYKMQLQGKRIGYALHCRYTHLDATAGRRVKTKLEEKIIRYYSVSRNRTIFWYKFLWLPANSLSRKIHVLCGGLYGIVNYTLYNLVINCHPKNWKAIAAMFKGYADAYRSIKI